MKSAALAAAALALALTACTTNAQLTADKAVLTAPSAQSVVLLVDPDVQLSLLTASGMQQERADWGRQGHDNLRAEIEGDLKTRAHPIKILDREASMTGETGQVMRLNEAVGRSIAAFSYGAMKLPSKKGAFDWTLGDGAVRLGREQGVEYALFVTARGSYSSAGRQAAMIGMAMLGVSIPLGSQQVFASLVDLRTGRVVWFNQALAGPSADMRNAQGAHELVASVLKGAPL